MLIEELWELAYSHFAMPRTFPRTPEQAADRLYDALSPQTLEALTQVRLEDLPDHDESLSDYCRHMFGLDGRNDQLVKACGFLGPDDAVALVIRMVWAKAMRRKNLKVQ